MTHEYFLWNTEKRHISRIYVKDAQFVIDTSEEFIEWWFK